MHTYSSLFEQGTRTGNSQYDILGVNLSIFERKIHVGKGLEDKTKKILAQEQENRKLAGNFNFYQLIDVERLEMSELWQIFATDHNFPT